MNKQIEEMAKALLDSEVVIDGLDRAFARVRGVENSRFEKMARYLVDTQGYRKSTDVAMEIFEKVTQAIKKGTVEANQKIINSTTVLDFREILMHTGEMYAGYIGKSICEVFKKYESEGMQND